MPQTKMFRDRVVSMEQTLEGGEKNLELLKSLCREAFPDFQYKEHALDHERDLFVMRFEAADGRKKSVGWTRMVLFDPERIPAIIGDPLSPLRAKLVAFLGSRVGRSEVLVTFRHLEEGWTDTPEPRREKRRRRGRPEARGGRPPSPASPPQAQRPKGGPRPTPGRGMPVAGERRPEQAAVRPPGETARPPGGRRRRFRRRRRGRGGSGAPPGAGRPPSAGS
jgi:hypothetical protein